MDVFQINQQDDRPIELTVKNYEYKTRKTDPFYVEVNKVMKYYAVCPACKNPIIIVNLYVDKTLDENKNKMPVHAKHCKYDVTNLAEYSQEAYDVCPLGNPSKFGGSSKHRSKNRSNEIVGLIKNYPVVLYNEIRRITCIDFTEKTFSAMINTFIKAEGYYYKYINKYNLPYGFLNMQKSIRIYKNKLYYSPFKSEMIKSINNSEFFQYKDYIITPKLKDGFYEIELYLANHKIDSEYEIETIDLIIIEKSNGKTNEVFNKTVKIDIEKYINAVDKHRRINGITEAIKLVD
ncbi:hypothetical protein ABES58_14030 [Paenibacillus lautus]|uniref:hypothetical protein n=1 Tax=Paenibacillus lautus TaxID=1401 RepID=UPI003D2D6E7E